MAKLPQAGKRQAAGKHPSRTVPLTSMVSGSRQGRFFNELSAQATFHAAGVAPLTNDFASAAENLDLIAYHFVTSYRQHAAATAGEREAWFRKIESRAKALLAAFDMHDPLEEPGPEIVHALLRDGPLADGHEIHLRRLVGGAVGAPAAPSEWDAANAALHGVQLLMLRARLSAAKVETEKQAVRQAAPGEVGLVLALDQLFERVTGQRRAYTVDDFNETKGGPFVDFVAAVAAQIEARLHIVDPDAERDSGLAGALTDLSHTPFRIMKRIRKARRLADRPK